MTKPPLIAVLFFILTMGSAGSVQSYTITTTGELFGTDVGALDGYIAEGNLQGSPASELAWVNTFLDPDVSYNGYKTEIVNYYATDTSGVFAFSLLSSPGFYIIKNATRIALFRNENDYSWGVFSIASLSFDMNLPDFNEMTISHITEFGGTTVLISEPTSLTLFILALLALSICRHRSIHWT